MSEEITTEQVNKQAPNPTGKGGFGDHPENRSPGGWDKNNSYSYWLNFFKSLSVEEFNKYQKENKDTMTMAAVGAWTRLAKSRELREFQEVANRTEGMPKQPLEHSTGDGEFIIKIETVDEDHVETDQKAD